jgi:hypothetical protein
MGFKIFLVVILALILATVINTRITLHTSKCDIMSVAPCPLP